MIRIAYQVRRLEMSTSGTNNSKGAIEELGIWETVLNWPTIKRQSLIEGYRSFLHCGKLQNTIKKQVGFLSHNNLRVLIEGELNMEYEPELTLKLYRVEIYRAADQDEAYDKFIEVNEYQLKDLIKYIKVYEVNEHER